MESGPLLALAIALVLGIINSELPSPYWNLNVVENELPFTGLREAALIKVAVKPFANTPPPINVR